MFCAKLNEALADEHQAPIDYKELEGLARFKKDKNTIKKISSQERKHFDKLKEIKKRVCSIH